MAGTSVLSGETRVNGHDGDEIDVVKNVRKRRRGRCWTERYTSLDSASADLLQGPLQVACCFKMNGDEGGSEARGALDVSFRLFDHEMADERWWGLISATIWRRVKSRAKLGTNLAIHHVEVEVVDLRLVELSNIVLEIA